MEIVAQNAEVSRKPLFGLNVAELRAVIAEFGQPGYRAEQMALALYRQRVTSIDEMTTLPAGVRTAMQAAGWVIGLPEMAQTAKSVDGTERYLVRMADGETVETVWMPGGDGGYTDPEDDDAAEAGVREYKRATICVSSQVGCAVNCQFCLTAKLGIRRNLTAGEIAGQVAAVLNRHGVELGSGRGRPKPDRINLVFMGMGEPFLNYDAFMKAAGLLSHGMMIPEARMTVSTSGILPGIERYAAEPVRPRLALSLNASNDQVRERVMPITRKWNIAALLAAVKAIPLRGREWVTFEYVLLGGVNDQPEHAEELIRLIAGMRAKVNLIVWNAGPGMEFKAPQRDRVMGFQARLIEAGLQTYVRRPRGADIFAACGQLKRTVEVPAAGVGELVTLAG